MTLLVGSRSSTHVVVSADGISAITKHGIRHVSRLDLQKIFPAEHTTIAIGHHGENKLAGVDVGPLIKGFLSSNTLTSVPNTAELLVRQFDGVIRDTLVQIPDAERCAFWVCGFSLGTKMPAITELEWKKNVDSIEFQQIEAGDLFMSGSGHDCVSQFIKDPIDGQFSWDKLWSANEGYHLRFHEKLWKVAESRRNSTSEQQLFGGHRHAVVLTPKGWRWEIAPMLPKSGKDCHC